MTIANKITLSRLALSVAIFFLIIKKTFFFEVSALIVLIIATVSDYVDGKIARETNTITKFGAIADPFADKVLVMSCFLAFASIKMDIPLWAIFLIILRELAVSTLRVLAALQNYVLKAEAAGKFKTLTQFISIYVIMLILVLNTMPNKPLWVKKILEISVSWPYILSVTAAFITVLSGIIYTYTHYKMLKNSWGEKKKSDIF